MWRRCGLGGGADIVGGLCRLWKVYLKVDRVNVQSLIEPWMTHRDGRYSSLFGPVPVSMPKCCPVRAISS